MRKMFFLFSFLIIVMSIIIGACVNEQSVKYTRYFADGAQLYKTNCQNCHGAAGDGLALLIPPLTDTLFLRNNRTKLACIIQYGLAEPIVVNGETYNFKMPANQKLAPIDMAKLLTFVTNSYGNKQGLFDVLEVENHLKNCR